MVEDALAAELTASPDDDVARRTETLPVSLDDLFPASIDAFSSK